jgi:formylglycine-generating enzyme
MKRRLYIALTLVGASVTVAACSFGVDVGGYFGGGAPDSSSDATVDAALTGPPSCAGDGPGLSNCGPASDESCCASPLVSGGNFFRSYDGSAYKDAGSPARVSNFRLDRFEVTVGRFRKFVAASEAGWKPDAKSGKHLHLNQGKGLAQGSSENLFELGWDSSWNKQLASSSAQWTEALRCNPKLETWTESPGEKEAHPILCATWFVAAAFCIWDGGFLPSEAEWNYAASGGELQRVYPWSSPPAPTVLNCEYASYDDCSPKEARRVGDLPNGDGRWKQANLAGNAFEWNLDWKQEYPMPCTDCASLVSSDKRVLRSGSYFNNVTYLPASERFELKPDTRDVTVGVRCARPPG